MDTVLSAFCVRALDQAEVPTVPLGMNAQSRPWDRWMPVLLCEQSNTILWRDVNDLVVYTSTAFYGPMHAHHSLLVFLEAPADEKAVLAQLVQAAAFFHSLQTIEEEYDREQS